MKFYFIYLVLFINNSSEKIGDSGDIVSMW